MTIRFQQIVAAHRGWYRPGEYGDGGIDSTIYGVDTEGRVWRLDDEREWTEIPAPEAPGTPAEYLYSETGGSGQ
jgi:hypothetical protein